MSRSMSLPMSLAIPILIFASTAQAQPTTIDLYDDVVAYVEIVRPSGDQELVRMGGRCETWLYWEGAVEGIAQDDDGDGRDDVELRMSVLTLTGFSQMVGPLELNLNASMTSPGQLEEQINNIPGQLDLPPYGAPGSADSFFDIFCELVIVYYSDLTLHNQQPQTIAGNISNTTLQVGEILLGSQVTTLYDPSNEDAGWQLCIRSLRFVSNYDVVILNNATAELEIRDAAGVPLIFNLEGQAEIHLMFEDDTYGIANDFDNNGRDEIFAEMVSLELTGEWFGGGVTLTSNSDQRLHGCYEETVNNIPGQLDLPPYAGSGNADSFFDIYCELSDGNASQWNRTPHQIAGVVSACPAGPYEDLSALDYNDLFDEAGEPTWFLMRLNHLWLVPDMSPVDGNTPAAPGLQLSAAPNPFNPRVKVSFSANQAGPAVLRVHDLRGQAVATLFNGIATGGEQTVSWDGRNNDGQAVASGSYLLRLETASGVTGHKILLAR